MYPKFAMGIKNKDSKGSYFFGRLALRDEIHYWIGLEYCNLLS